MHNDENLYLYAKISSFSYNKDNIKAPKIGSIIVDEDGETHISIFLSNSIGDINDAEKIGQVIHSIDFAEYVSNLNLSYNDIEV